MQNRFFFVERKHSRINFIDILNKFTMSVIERNETTENDQIRRNFSFNDGSRIDPTSLAAFRLDDRLPPSTSAIVFGGVF